MERVVADFAQRPRAGAVSDDELFTASSAQHGSQVMFVSCAQRRLIRIFDAKLGDRRDATRPLEKRHFFARRR
jgi:carbonic anhydrase